MRHRGLTSATLGLGHFPTVRHTPPHLVAAGCLGGLVGGWWVGGWVGWDDWLKSSQVGWLGWPDGWLAGWLDGWLAGLVGWLVGWLEWYIGFDGWKCL